MKARVTWLVTLMVCWLSASAAFAEGALNSEAQKHFDAGLAYADDPGGPKWDEAMKEFLAAYAISPTWKLKNNIGLCALHLERDGEAIEAYQEYLDHGGESGLSAKHRQQIKKDVAMLSASLVRVSIEVEPEDAVIVDERKAATGELRINRYPVKDGKVSIGMHPGTHHITVEATGYVSGTWNFDADPASTHQRRFKLEPEKAAVAPATTPETDQAKPTTPLSDAPKSAERHSYTGTYIGLAATGVFVAATTTIGVLALQKNKQFDDATDPDQHDSLKKSGKTLVLLTDIGIGASVVSAGVTAYLYFTAPKATPAKAANASNARFDISPVLSASTAGVAVTGKF